MISINDYRNKTGIFNKDPAFPVFTSACLSVTKRRREFEGVENLVSSMGIDYQMNQDWVLFEFSVGLINQRPYKKTEADYETIIPENKRIREALAHYIIQDLAVNIGFIPKDLQVTTDYLTKRLDKLTYALSGKFRIDWPILDGHSL